MLKKLTITMILIVIGLLFSGSLMYQNVSAQAQQTEPENDSHLRTVSVIGTGQASASPDLVVARLGVRTEAATAQEALSQNNQQMQALLDELRNSGVASADIQTQSIQLQPRYEENPGQQGSSPSLVGYTAVNIVQVRIRDLERLGEILDRAVSSGGNTIEGIQFEIENSSDLYQQALQEAMTDARGKAELLADQAGAQLGEIMSISEGFASPFPIAAGAAAPVEQAVPIEPGMQSVTANIQVTWLLGGSDILPSTGGTPAPTARPSPTQTNPSTLTTPSITTVTPAAATPSPGGVVSNFDELVEALREAGARVETAGNIQQPFFPVEGLILQVNGMDVQVFEFQDEASRRAVSETISETGEVIGTSIPLWSEQPNFWGQGRIIVLYFGEDQDQINLLNSILGEPITQFEAAQGLPPVAAVTAQQKLAYRLGLSTDQVEILSSEQVAWSNSCLGLPRTDEACLQVITPGWRIILQADGNEYEAHTDRLGETIRWK